MIKSSKRMALVLGASVGSVGLGACQDVGDVDGTQIVAAEANDLRISQIEIDHSYLNGERLLTVRGLGDGDQTIATATLRTGMVLYTSEPELTAATWSAGTELVLTAGEIRSVYVTPDRTRHQNAPLYQPSLERFVALSSVADAIEEEAGIRFALPRDTSEVVLAATNCDSSKFPTTKANPQQCCQDTIGTTVTTFHKVNSTDGSINGLLGIRTFGATCTNADGSFGCGANCNFGPCGAHPQDPQGTSAAAVFTPTSAPTQCGRDSNGAASGGSTEIPEAYAAQTLKPGVTGTCGWAGCLTNGNRVNYTYQNASGTSAKMSLVTSPATNYAQGVSPYTVTATVTVETTGWTFACIANCASIVTNTSGFTVNGTPPYPSGETTVRAVGPGSVMYYISFSPYI